LKTKGFPIVDADQLAREIVEPGTRANLEIKDFFGTGVMNADGSINRKALGQQVFSDKKKLDRLNEITHKEIIAEIKLSLAHCEKEGRKVSFLDAPLLFELGLDSLVDETWVLDAPDHLRIKRVLERDSITKEEIQARISTQMPRSIKNQKATVVIDNSRGVEELREKIDQLIMKYEF
jgi:dephospho-CoA kinase